MPTATTTTTTSPATLDRLLYDRKSAAYQLCISVRALDYLIAGGSIGTRRIGSRVLIPVEELKRFASKDHLDSVIEAA